MKLENRTLYRATVLSILLCMIFYVPCHALENESGSLLEFFSGTNYEGAYNNWISHTSEADWSEDTYEARMDWTPPELDKENNDFGRYQVVDSLNNPDQIMGELGLFFNFPPDAIRKFASSNRKS